MMTVPNTRGYHKEAERRDGRHERHEDADHGPRQANPAAEEERTERHRREREHAERGDALALREGVASRGGEEGDPAMACVD